MRNDHVHPIFGAVLGSLLNPVENAKKLEGAMSETTTAPMAWREERREWAEYLRLSAAAERLQAASYARFAEAELMLPLNAPEEREKRAAHYRALARDYLEMADKAEREARGETEPTPCACSPDGHADTDCGCCGAFTGTPCGHHTSSSRATG